MLLKITLVIALVINVIRFLYPAIISITWQFYINPAIILLIASFLIGYLFKTQQKKSAIMILIMFLQYWPISLLFDSVTNFLGLPVFSTIVVFFLAFTLIDSNDKEYKPLVFCLVLTYLSFSFMVTDNIHTRYIYEKPWPYEALTPTGEHTTKMQLTD